jgi:hypothetical protein
MISLQQSVGDWSARNIRESHGFTARGCGDDTGVSVRSGDDRMRDANRGKFEDCDVQLEPPRGLFPA